MTDYNYKGHKIITGDDIFSIIKINLCNKITESLEKKPFFSLALSGGTTPAKLYSLLAGEKLPWNKIKIFLVDERVVPPESDGLNWKMIRNDFLDKLPLKSCVFYPENIYYDPFKASLEIEETLKAELYSNQRGIPVIDIVLLGVGSDGHTASLFYNKKGFYEKEKLITVTDAPPPYEKRITFTFPLLEAAGERWFLVSGKEKKDIIRTIFSGDNIDLPAVKAASYNPSIWFLDKECMPDELN